MRKYIAYSLIVVIGILLIWCFIPRSCNSDIEYTGAEYRVMKANILDSILNVQELKYQAVQDSIIRSGDQRDSVAKLKISILEKGYEAQKAIIRHLKTIRVDSSGQVVNNVPVEEYNALVGGFNKCDSMLVIERGRIDQKDSAFTAMSNKFDSERKLTDSMRDRLEVTEDLNDNYKKQIRKLKKENKVLKFVLGVVTIAHLFH